MKEPVFKGSCTAVITPFGADGLDIGRLGAQLERQISGGTAAIVAAGTTGEAATLSQREYDRLLAFCARTLHSPVKLIAGIGGNNTEECLEKARMAEAAGADALLLTTPYYNKTTQAGLAAHFFHIADHSALPLILYNIPSRTGITITKETYVQLSKHPNINGVKEASGNLSTLSMVAAECGEELHIWCGNDDMIIPMMALGAKGAISVASNLIPGKISRLCRLCLNGDFAEARASYMELARLCELLFVETNPIPIKDAMAQLGLDSGQLRLPLVNLSQAHHEALTQELKQLRLL